MRELLAAGAATVGMSVVLSLIAKATVITAVAMVAGWLARRRAAAVRHLILVAAFVALALLPVATAIMPAVRVPILLAPAPASGDGLLPATVSRPAEALSGVTGRRIESRDGIRVWPARAAPTVLTAVWLAGVFGCLVPVAVGLWQIRRVRVVALPWRGGQVMADDLALQAGFLRPIDVMVHHTITGPLTSGVLRPAILFPTDARTWRDADVRRALIHELEHVRRCDWITLCLARVMCAAYWFHPLIWIANRQLLVTAERACDDAVLRRSPALGYADQLVTLAERSLARRRQPLLAMANRRDLTTRVRAVLDVGQQRGPAGACTRIVVAMTAVLSIGSLAPMRTVAVAGAQTSGTVRPQFDVASVKPSPFFDRIMSVRLLPGRLTADATLQVLMQYGYGVQPFQLRGGPSWLASNHYAIEAKADASASRDQMVRMLQSLLEDRFQLKTHREMKDLPVLMLVSDRGGFKRPAPKEDTCVDSPAAAPAEWVGAGRMAAPGELPAAKGRCGSALVGLGRLSGGKLPMSELVRVLSLVLGRRVIDKTGVAERFDLELDFVPDETTPALPPPPPGTPVAGVTIATALQQQLGLRLESGRAPVDVIVVDKAERPSAN